MIFQEEQGCTVNSEIGKKGAERKDCIDAPCAIRIEPIADGIDQKEKRSFHIDEVDVRDESVSPGHPSNIITAGVARIQMR